MSDQKVHHIHQQQGVESPCVRNCCLDEQDICLGCFRSLEEIVQWGAAIDRDKQLFLENAARRRYEHHVKYSK